MPLPVPIRLALPAILAAGCAAATTASFVDERRPTHRVVEGFVIRLEDLRDPVVRKLHDGVAYTVTQPGAALVMEFQRGRRQRFELQPGDVFVQGRPYSYLLRPIPAR